MPKKLGFVVVLCCCAAFGQAAIPNARMVDGVTFTTIQAAIDDIGSNTGVVIVPSNHSISDTGYTCGSNITVLDFRGSQTTIDGNCTIAFNALSAQAGTSHAFIDARQTLTAATTSSAAVLGAGTYNGSLSGANGQSLESVNGTTFVGATVSNVPASLFVVGVEGSAQLATSGSGLAFPDLRGVTGNVQLNSGNTGNVNRAVGVYGQAVTVAGTGIVSTAISGYFEDNTAGTGYNGAVHAEGQSSFGGTPSNARIYIDVLRTGAIMIRGDSTDAALSPATAGSLFWRTDLLRPRFWDGGNWHTLPGNDTTDIFTNKSTAAGPLAGTVANGTVRLGTRSIASGKCASTVTTAATGVVTTDVVSWSFNADPNGAHGYGAGTSGALSVWAFPSAGKVNFRVCNLTGSAIIPGAVKLNWRVLR